MTTKTSTAAPLSHDDAMDLIRKALTVTVISYDEAIAIYLRARGFLCDGAPVLGLPVPEDWLPPSTISEVERILDFHSAWISRPDTVIAKQIALSASIAMAGRISSPVHGVPSVIREIAAERRRQIREEGFSHKHDDKFVNGELGQGASSYLIRAWCSIGRAKVDNQPSPWWPFSDAAWKPASIRRMLVKAAAMIVAEIERLDRAAAKGGEA